jgi:hypothetical protein
MWGRGGWDKVVDVRRDEAGERAAWGADGRVEGLNGGGLLEV